MASKQLLIFVILIYSSVSFSQDSFLFGESILSQDSLRNEFNAFVKEMESHPIDTNHIAPKLTDNYQLIWTLNVRHSAPYYVQGNLSFPFCDSNGFVPNEVRANGTSYWSTYFRGDDYFVIYNSFNNNMSTIFNSTFYYKRKKITSLADLHARGAIEWGDPSGPTSGSYLDYSIFTAEIDSSLRVGYNTFFDSISVLPTGILDTNAIYKLRYHYGTSSGFDLYSGNKNYEYLYQGNDIVVSYQDVMELINSSRFGVGFSAWILYGDVIKYTSHISRHGGTFDVEAQHIYYFEKI